MGALHPIDHARPLLAERRPCCWRQLAFVRPQSAPQSLSRHGPRYPDTGPCSPAFRIMLPFYDGNASLDPAQSQHLGYNVKSPVLFTCGVVVVLLAAGTIVLKLGMPLLNQADVSCGGRYSSCKTAFGHLITLVCAGAGIAIAVLWKKCH